MVLELTGLMVQRMGGNRWAQVIAAGSAAISGVALSQGSIFMYVFFDLLWWVLVAYGVISLLKTRDARWWLVIGVAISLLIFLPYLLWMAQHDFISIQKLSAMHARDVGNGHYQWFLLEQLYSAANPSSYTCGFPDCISSGAAPASPISVP